MRPLVLMSAFSLVASIWCASTQTHPRKAIDSALDCGRRSIVVSVEDKKGLSVAGLLAADFRAALAGQEIPIRSAGTLRTQPRVVVLLDASGSMLTTKDGKWDLARRIAGDILVALPPESEIGLLVFTNRVDDAADFQLGRSAGLNLLAALAGPKSFPKGPRTTALYDALLQARRMLGSSHIGDAFILITDGEDNASRANPDEVEKVFLHAGLRFFALVLSTPSRERYAHSSTLEELARATGGGRYLILGDGWFDRENYELNEPGSQALGAMLQHLYQVVLGSYVLELGPLPVIEKPRRLTIHLRKGVRRERLNVTFPEKVMPCEPPSNP